MSKKREKPRVLQIINDICATEGCGKVDALMVFGLRAVLAGMSRIPECYEHLILKGGTALHLALQEPIGRISTDLDLSLIDSAAEFFDPSLISEDVSREVKNVLADAVDDPAEITIHTPIDETHRGHAHLPALYKYRLLVEANLGSSARTVANANRFQIELAVDELVDATLLEELIVKPHGLPIRMRMYAPVQAISEKLRAILQKHQHYDRTGIAGSFNPRHVLDLVPLVRRLRSADEAKLRDLFHLKCERRLVSPEQRTVERLTNGILKAQVEASGHPQRAKAWALLTRLAIAVCS